MHALESDLHTIAKSLLRVLERELFIDNLLVRIHCIILMIRWTGLAPWEFEFPFYRQPYIYLPNPHGKPSMFSPQIHLARDSNSNLPAEKWLKLQAWFGPTLRASSVILSEAGICPPRDREARLGTVPCSWCWVRDHFRRIS